MWQLPAAAPVGELAYLRLHYGPRYAPANARYLNDAEAVCLLQLSPPATAR
jgi:hypothetical protein